ncbi:uncharacterized protein PHACADRAFT_203669 [Phanerochaete carnosa HHB-10118-sp]|uniref:Uncharacterized protein n=1 Tax=Phanerochaete carnosa (strain HHB-10118-sp) TaxID=650164 RepID=K5WMP6_PHACS|nr:uncharacterized protein PHACADRAFT_203669 [Phanerochaete carnosa HHB-10118-sp]EKM60469.1 hypothetical protein PHACADRAFT_203669 [Phanerochaete carnosa HHB-10118-sp]
MLQEKKRRKRRQRCGKEDTPALMQPPRQDDVLYRPQKTSSNGCHEPSSNESNGSDPDWANRSTHPPPTNGTARSPPDTHGCSPPQMPPLHGEAPSDAQELVSPKRLLIPGPEDSNVEPKRSRVDSTSRRISSPSA